MTAPTGHSVRSRLWIGVEKPPIFRCQTFSNLALYPVAGVCMYASGGLLLCWPLLSPPARQQSKEPWLQQKDLHLNIAPELNNSDNNDFC